MNYPHLRALARMVETAHRLASSRRWNDAASHSVVRIARRALSRGVVLSQNQLLRCGYECLPASYMDDPLCVRESYARAWERYNDGWNLRPTTGDAAHRCAMNSLRGAMRFRGLIPPSKLPDRPQEGSDDDIPF